MDGYNKAKTIQEKSKYLQENKNPLVPVVTLSDAFNEMNDLGLGKTTKIVGDKYITIVDPQKVEEGLQLMETEELTSNVAKFINAGKSEEEKDQKRDNIVKMFGLQENTRPYRKQVRSGRSSSGSQNKMAMGYDDRIGGDHEFNYLNVKGTSREGTLTDSTGQNRTNAIIEQIEAKDGVIYATGTYKDDDGAVHTAIFNYVDNKGAFEAAGGQPNIEKLKKRKTKDSTKSKQTSKPSASGDAIFGK